MTMPSVIQVGSREGERWLGEGLQTAKSSKNTFEEEGSVAVQLTYLILKLTGLGQLLLLLQKCLT